MAFWKRLFEATPVKSLALIDIGAGSVGGAFASYEEGEPPALIYARRLPIELRSDEPHERAMFRALDLLGQSLIREGAPALARATGSGSIDSVLVSVDSPWQETTVRTERFEGEEPFTFSKSLVAEALEKEGTFAAGKILCDESIIGTLLNGYETRQPYGKRARRASIIILASRIDQTVAAGIRSAIGGLFHTRSVRLIAGASLRYQAMRLAFPHEGNALVLDATGPLVAISLIRNGLLVALSETPDGFVGDAVWAGEVTEALAELAKQFPLPRSIFLLVRDADAASAVASLEKASLGSLWLSDNPPKIVPVQSAHIAALVRQASTFLPDVPLLLMTLFATEPLPSALP